MTAELAPRTNQPVSWVRAFARRCGKELSGIPLSSDLVRAGSSQAGSSSHGTTGRLISLTGVRRERSSIKEYPPLDLNRDAQKSEKIKEICADSFLYSHKHRYARTLRG
jgi:hypothetical protein